MIEETSNVRWILSNSVNDINFRSALPKLTDEELLFCLRLEIRKGARGRLMAQARKRGLEVPHAEV